MEVLLVGTGAADGWPNPFCGCASCAAQRAAGDLRGHTAALVDGRLLLDCGPEVPRAVTRLGRDLRGLRHLLFTHAHPDHVGPAALLWRSWAAPTGTLDVVGPAAALDLCRPWVDADRAGLRWRPVRAGDLVELDGGFVVRVLSAAHEAPGEAVLYDVTGPDGTRLLYATDTGPLPAATIAATAGASYDVVLLEETFGDADAAAGHLDLVSFPRQLARLRAAGAVDAGTDVVAVHLGDGNPPVPELSRRLAAWGARVVPDGTVLGQPAGGATPAPRRTLVLGGARSGKSVEAERRLAAEPVVTYVATALPDPDPEWVARIAEHRRRRPALWETVETLDVAAVLRAARQPVLVDCLSLWLAALDGRPDEKVQAMVAELLAAWRSVQVPVCAVSNEVGSGVVPPTPSGRWYRDQLGRLNARLAAASDEVLLMVAGRAVRV